MGTLVSDLLDLARNDAGRLRLQQCLTALVDNARPGPVTLAASTGPAGELVLHVIDRALASAFRWCVC